MGASLSPDGTDRIARSSQWWKLVKTDARPTPGSGSAPSRIYSTLDSGDCGPYLEGQFWTIEDLELAVCRWYGVQYQSRVSHYNLRHACGFSYQRTEKVFKSQRPLEIAVFQETTEKN